MTRARSGEWFPVRRKNMRETENHFETPGLGGP
jgi:hypothetical protein